MENIRRQDTSPDINRRKERTADLVNYIVHHANSELSYYCLVVNRELIDTAAEKQLLNVIIKDQTLHSSEFALRLLQDCRDLGTDARNALLARIVEQADKTTCSLALTLIPALGTWEAKLQKVFLN
jgi:hypothetical protein